MTIIGEENSDDFHDNEWRGIDFLRADQVFREKSPINVQIINEMVNQ